MIEAEALSARVGGFSLREATLTVPSGGYGVVIGPAGAGKTTLLETIAGVVPATGGRLQLWGEEATRRPPERRGVAMVYQRGYLFEHLDVDGNLAYGAADAETTREVRARFGVDALAGRAVRGLSGGERQLVALARALATRPRVLLLDEPFAALDPRRRGAARRELRALQRAWGFTVLQVTHDFAEAGALGDVVALMDAGRVVQRGTAEEVFRRPASPFAAQFLGAENVFDGEVIAAVEREGTTDEPRLLTFRSGGFVLHAVGDAPPGPAHAVLRGEEVLVARAPLHSSARNEYEGTVLELAPHGAVVAVTVEVDGAPVVATLTAAAARELALAPAERVWIAFKATAVHVV